MLNLFKRQKIDIKTLITDTGLALNQFADNSTAETMLSELGITRSELLKVTALDDEFESCREDIRSAVLARGWRIWGDGMDEDTINRLYKMLRPLLPSLAEIAINARLGGYAVGEYLYARAADGRWLVVKVLDKQGELDSYEPQRDGTLLYRGSDEMLLDLDVKYLLLASRTTGSNPKGDMLALRAYPAVQLRKKGLPYALQFIRRYAQPYVIGKRAGFGASMQDFVDKLYAFLNGGAIAVGNEDDVSILKMDSDGQAFARIEKLANSRIQKLLLGRVKTSELDSGSRAAQETDDDARQNRISAYLELLESACQHLLNAVLAANARYGIAIPAPQGMWFEFEKTAEISIERAERDEKYLSTGQVRFTKKYYTDILGYEDDHIELAGQTPATPASLHLSQDAGNSYGHTAGSDDLAHDRRILAPKINAILSALEQADDYAAFEKALAGLILPDGGMVDDLARKMQAARVAGENGAPTWPA